MHLIQLYYNQKKKNVYQLKPMQKQKQSSIMHDRLIRVKLDICITLVWKKYVINV